MRQKTKELSFYYDKWIEEAQKGMIDLYKEVEHKYEAVAERMQNVEVAKNKNLESLNACFQKFNSLQETEQ